MASEQPTVTETPTPTNVELDRAAASVVHATAQAIQVETKHHKEVLRRALERADRRTTEDLEAKEARRASHKRDRQ